jgi:phospholipid/cholesterol/gamma-HCH transport system ATP-binding protein
MIDEHTARVMRSRMGMLFQQGALFSSMSVFDNIAQPIRELGDRGRRAVAHGCFEGRAHRPTF